MPWRLPPAGSGPVRLDPPSPFDDGPGCGQLPPPSAELELDDGRWDRFDGGSDSLDPPPLSFR